ncbi:hypothetical protein MRB53_041114 [Persea americana]|nr:hypothetical protein MRB53_041114 [Persea americana]
MLPRCPCRFVASSQIGCAFIDECLFMCLATCILLDLVLMELSNRSKSKSFSWSKEMPVGEQSQQEPLQCVRKEMPTELPMRTHVKSS